MSQTHLSDQQLREFLNGNNKGYTQLLEHIESCSNCEQRLQDIVRIDTAHHSFPYPRVGDPFPAVENCANMEAFQLHQKDRFVIQREIAKGGMGVIVKAEDRLLRRTVALKVIKPEHENDAETIARFVQEARICGMLQHPGIVPVHDLGLLEGSKPFLTMKLIDGQTLADLILKEAPTLRLLEIFSQVCQTMAYVHSQDVIHRDLKPLNIMVGEFGEVQIMDWGIAKLIGAAEIQRLTKERNTLGSPIDGEPPTKTVSNRKERHADENDWETHAGEIIGTPSYMPPEQALGQIKKMDKRADVFALGAMLCEILTGQPPNGNLPADKALQFAQEPDYTQMNLWLDESNQDQALTELVKTCLSPEISSRPQDANEVCAVVLNWKANAQLRLRQMEIDVAKVETTAASEKKRQRLTIAVAALLLALATTAIVGLLYLADQNAKAMAARERTRQLSIENDREINRYLNRANEKRATAMSASPLKPEAWESVLHEVDLAKNLIDENTDTQLQLLVDNIKADIDQQISFARADAATQNRFKRTQEQLDEARRRLIDYEARELAGDTRERKAVWLYEAAFTTFGIEPDSSISEAIKLFKAAPQEIQDSMIAGLQEWHSAYRNYNPTGDFYGRWLRTLYEVMDYKEHRMSVRSAYLNDDLDKLNALLKETIVFDEIEFIIAAAALNRHGNHLERRELLRTAVSAYPNSFWLNYFLAFDYNSRNPLMLESALSHYFICGAIEPDCLLAVQGIGSTYIKQNRYAQALAHFERLTALKPNVPHFRVGLGAMLLRHQRLPEALAQLEKALELNPMIAQAHVNIGEVHTLLKQFDKAKLAYERAIEIDPKLPDTYVSIAHVSMQLSDFDAAAEALRKLFEFAPDHSNGLSSQAQLYLHQRKFCEAEKALKRAIELSPQDIGQYVNLNIAQRALSKHQEALATLLTAEELDPSDYRVQQSLATIYEILEQPEKALVAKRKSDELRRVQRISDRNLETINKG